MLRVGFSKEDNLLVSALMWGDKIPCPVTPRHEWSDTQPEGVAAPGQVDAVGAPQPVQSAVLTRKDTVGVQQVDLLLRRQPGDKAVEAHNPSLVT